MAQMYVYILGKYQLPTTNEKLVLITAVHNASISRAKTCDDGKLKTSMIICKHNYIMRLQHPHSPPGQTPGIWIFEDWIVHIPAPLGPKWCSNALPYRGICLSNAPPKEQSSSTPVIFNKACV